MRVSLCLEMRDCLRHHYTGICAVAPPIQMGFSLDEHSSNHPVILEQLWCPIYLMIVSQPLELGARAGFRGGGGGGGGATGAAAQGPLLLRGPMVLIIMISCFFGL